MAQSNVVVDMFEQYPSMVGPMVKTNRMTVAKLEKLVEFQMSSLQSYVDLSLGRMKAAADVQSVEDLQDFYKGQMEASKELQQMMLSDTRILLNMLSGFQSDFGSLAEENVKEMSDKTAKAAEVTADKAKETTSKAAKEAKEAANKAS